MDKEFVPYEQALALKELGFDEPCMASRDMNNDEGLIQIPLKQQAFRWFRDKYGLYHYVTTHDSTDFEWYIYDKDQNDFEDDTTQNTYEEAELACLIKLIEIVKNK